MNDNFLDKIKDITPKYPWLRFEVSLKSLPYSAWIQLGECLSKCQHLSRIPLRPDTASEMRKVYLAKGVSATTAIEGNSLSEGEVRQIIEKKLELPPSRQYLKQEVDNILFLCNELKEKIYSGEKFVITPESIKHLNKIILKDVPLPDYAVPGEFRKVSVVAGTYKAVDTQDVEALTEAMCVWINSDYFVIRDADPIVGSIVRAVAAHIYLEWIHPFGDGNGRVGRMLEFAILTSAGVPSPAAHLLSNHYNQTRTEYYRQLSVATQKRDIGDFIIYAAQGFRDGLAEQLKYVFAQVLDISWETYVYETFRGHKRSDRAEKRMRTLVLELSRKNEAVAKENITILSPKLIELYKRVRSERTLSRDLNDLVKVDLIEQTVNGYRARKEKMLSFLPLRAIGGE